MHDEVPTWRQIAARAAAVLRVWYRHDVRRWWRRNVATRRFRFRVFRPVDDRPSSNPAVVRLAEADVSRYLEGRPGVPIKVAGCAGGAGGFVAYSTAPTGFNALGLGGAAFISGLHGMKAREDHEALARLAELQGVATYRARRVYQPMSDPFDSIDTIAGVNPYTLPFPRRSDEPS